MSINPLECIICGGRDFWVSPYDMTLCQICNPPLVVPPVTVKQFLIVNEVADMIKESRSLKRWKMIYRAVLHDRPFMTDSEFWYCNKMLSQMPGRWL